MNEKTNPAELATPNGFSHVCVTNRTNTIYVSGQVSYDKGGNIVGENDLEVQTAQVYENIRTALAAVGATMEDIVKTTLYVKALDPEKAKIIRKARSPFLSENSPPTSTMVGVASLAKPALLLEVEAIAMTL